MESGTDIFPFYFLFFIVCACFDKKLQETDSDYQLWEMVLKLAMCNMILFIVSVFSSIKKDN